MRPILERLMLSDLSEANDPFFLQHHEVQAILYYGDGGMFPDDIKLYNRPAQADGSLAPAQLRDGIDFLRESLRAGRRVLSVGKSGATIVAAYLVEMGFSEAQALQMISESTTSVPRPDAEAVRTLGAELRRRSELTLGHR
jgi:hypothetical protein